MAETTDTFGTVTIGAEHAKTLLEAAGQHHASRGTNLGPGTDDEGDALQTALDALHEALDDPGRWDARLETSDLRDRRLLGQVARVEADIDSDDAANDRDDESHRETVDATLSVGGADCDVTSARLEDCDDRRLTIKLSEDGLREFITELRLEEYDADAADWLADHSTADFGTLEGGESDE